MIKKTNFIIPLVIYPFELMLSVGETDEQLRKVLKKHNLEKDEFLWKYETETAAGRFCLFETNHGLIRMRAKPKTPEEYGTLHHEIFHYVMHVFDRMGLKWHRKSDEAYSYMIGYLTGQVYKVLK